MAAENGGAGQSDVGGFGDWYLLKTLIAEYCADELVASGLLPSRIPLFPRIPLLYLSTHPTKKKRSFARCIVVMEREE